MGPELARSPSRFWLFLSLVTYRQASKGLPGPQGHLDLYIAFNNDYGLG